MPLPYSEFLPKTEIDPFLKHVLADAAEKKRPARKRAVKWNGVEIAHKNSLMTQVRKIARFAKKQEFVTNGIVGVPGTGKTTLARTTAHIFHEMMSKYHNIDYEVLELGEEDMLNMAKTLERVTTHTCILFDDVSFLKERSPAKQFAEAQAAITRIRHRSDDLDVRVAVWYGYHYTKALSRYLRGVDFNWVTSVSSSEFSNFEEMMGKSSMNLVRSVERMRRAGINNDRWSVGIGSGKKDRVVYTYDRPFRPAIFWDQARAFNVVYPEREWLAPKCAVCNASQNKTVVDIDPEQLWAKHAKAFGESHAAVALKLVAHDLGHGSVWGRSTRYCYDSIKNDIRNTTYTLDDIVNTLERHDPKRTRGAKKAERDAQNGEKPAETDVRA